MAQSCDMTSEPSTKARGRRIGVKAAAMFGLLASAISALGAVGTAASANTAAATATKPTLKAGRQTVTLTVDGQNRTAVVYVPTKLSGATPLVFGFHGHGGSGANYARKTPINSLWPAAVAVYPDGLTGHKGLTDPTGVKSGWQTTAGELADRDLHFFDSLLAYVAAAVPIDRDRIYATGHSNGAAFTALLWQQRGSQLAAIATAGGQPGAKTLTAPPRSVYMQMGRQDPIVPFDQQVRSVNLVKARLGIALNASGTKLSADTTSFRSANGLELVVQITDTGHTPPASLAPQVAAFFQRHHR